MTPEAGASFIIICGAGGDGALPLLPDPPACSSPPAERPRLLPLQQQLVSNDPPPTRPQRVPA